MTASQVNALIASSYNIHVGPIQRGAFMSPDKAAALPRGERANLCAILRDKGGSDLYTKAQAETALLAILERRA